jgi:small-conductance mechanosensitive channel
VAEVTAIEEQLPDALSTIAEAKAGVEKFLDSGPRLERLSADEREWAARQSQLEAWSDTLTHRAEQLQKDLAKLDDTAELWRRTRDAAKAAEAPPEVLGAIDADLEAVAETRKKALVRRDRVLSVLNETTQGKLTTSDALAQLAAARAALRENVFAPDAAPLWSALGDLGGTSSIASGIANGFREDRDDLVHFVTRNAGAFPIVVLGFLMSLAAALVIRRNLRHRAERQTLAGSIRVFERPVSVAVLIALMIASAVYPLAPSIAISLVGLVVLVPLFRIVSPVVHPAFTSLLLVLAGFYVFDQLCNLLDAVRVLERLLFFFQTLAGAGFIVWLLRPHRLARIPADIERPASLGTALKIASVLLGLSALANLFGFMTFAEILGRGTFGAAYLGALMFAAQRVALTSVVVTLSTERAQRLGIVKLEGEHILRWSRFALRLGAVLLWAYLTLGAFAVRDAVAGKLTAILTTPLEVGTVAISLGEVLGFGVTIVAALTLSRIITAMLRDDVLPRVHLARGVDNAITTSVHYALLFAGFLLALGAAGIDMSRFAILAGAFGVGIGFGLQNIVNNFVSGLVLLYERPVGVGDMVEVGDLLGTVTRIGIRSSTVRTFQGSEVIVPNANLITEQLINWTLSDAIRRIDLPVGVAYGSDHERVQEVLREAIASVENVHSQPEPIVLFQGLGDSSLDFEVRLWTDAPIWPWVHSAAMGEIYAGLARAGIEIPFPQRDLHFKSVRPEVAKALGERGTE